MTDKRAECGRVVEWLLQRVIGSARGDSVEASSVEPRGRFWLGRLTSEAAVALSPFGDRTERMEPCAIGFRFRPSGPPPWTFDVIASGCGWTLSSGNGRPVWRKSPLLSGRANVTIPAETAVSFRVPLEELDLAFENALGARVLKAGLSVDVEQGRPGMTEVVLCFVNESPPEADDLPDTGIYQAALTVQGEHFLPFQLEALPDSFRYDRNITAYGINCGVEVVGPGILRSADTITADRPRPIFWTASEKPPNLDFDFLAETPLPSLSKLVEFHGRWGESEWSATSLDRRAVEEQWSNEMRQEADRAAVDFQVEARRLKEGLELLTANEMLRESFRLMNEAMAVASRGRYRGWRPFQAGFILANLSSVLPDGGEAEYVDILWFPTGGGKTETYLGLLLLAAFHDRMSGKEAGITAWSRFPLRLLSLQQTQRFGDAVAAAELIRRKHRLGGDCFSLGFFVGDSSTPNRIKLNPGEGEPNSLDERMPARYQVLLRCPFCDADVEMAFDRRLWRLEHRCTGGTCPWPDPALPVFIVDEEIYRFLPTIVVGTLDKVASISMQAAMKGFVSAPHGVCSEPGHGYTYAARSERPQGCLVPQCPGSRRKLSQEPSRFPPSFRLQDELHLLRDSLGAIDAHYESLLDHLTEEAGGTRSKVVASSATLTGYERQCQVLYRRSGRVFPAQGPRSDESFWLTSSNDLLRRFVSLAPRGATLEFAADRILTELQRAIRELLQDPERICKEVGLDRESVSDIASLYGTNVVYGNTIRDLDASLRSLETQVPVDPLVTATLTGQTPFPLVRSTLDRLQSPEPEFGDRIHVVAASSMMSHGVDIDRLNSMVMLGLPLATAEFVQATARIGRTWPGIVFVLHKMALERDASVYRCFRSFVDQGDRFIEAIPITRRSRRVLERTLAGLVMARVQHVHEPACGKPLTTVERLRAFCKKNGVDEETEATAVELMLGFESGLDDGLREQTEFSLAAFFRSLNDPAISEIFPNKLFSTPVMRSLRDVEEQAPVQNLD